MTSFYKLWPVFILVSLISGCANHVQPQYPPSVEQNSKYGAILIDPTMQLKGLITVNKSHSLVINERLMQQVLSQQKTTERQLITNSLLNITNQQLLPNEEFERINQVVSSNNKSPKYAFADQLSQFITSDNFSCQQPIYAKYFTERYNRLEDHSLCDKEVPFNLISTKNIAKTFWLNPERVSEVHLLFAGKDDGLMSKFGHISLRLIVCPENNNSKIECDKNLYEHIVLGYRAHVDEFSTDPLKGIVGDYKSYLYANNFMDIYREYTVDEFRDLHSLPLKLEKEKLTQFVRGLSEIHWSYSGEYKFITKNCSTLLQATLSVLWPDLLKDPLMNETYWRPDNLFSAVRNSNLSDSTKFKNLSNAEEEGFYFPSTEPIYNRALDIVNKALASPKFENLESYIGQDPLKRYENLVLNASYYRKLKSDKYLNGAQLLLEELSATRYQAYMKSKMAYFFHINSISAVESHMLGALDSDEIESFSVCILNPIKDYMEPAKRMNGIPEHSTMSAEKEKTYMCNSIENRVHMKAVRLELESIDPENWRPVKLSMLYWVASLDNVERLLDLKKS